MTKGASIRLAAPTGLRFQTTVKSGNGIAADEILNSKTVTTGTLITTLDLYTTHGTHLQRRVLVFILFSILQIMDGLVKNQIRRQESSVVQLSISRRKLW